MPMRDAQTESSAILLTGATGFLGKVVLALLLRERRDLRINRIHVLIRAESQQAAEARFETEIVGSACMADRTEALRALARPVLGDCAEPRCGLADEVFETLTSEGVRVIHCAASVEFDLPLEDATRANVEGALNVLAFAQACSKMTSMVSVSTAYVTPHQSDATPIQEALSPLPLARFDDDPEVLLRAIRAGELETEALLRECGHPNTYTLTKCLAEHLLTRRSRRCGSVPLTIVRPSIIAASRRAPMPGWIDSPAALAAFVLMLGSGYLRVVAADLEARLDIVPCDEVAARVITAALASPPREEPAPIIHCVAGLENAGRIDVCQRRIIEYFRLHPVMGGPRLAYIGPNSEHGGWRFGIEHLIRHRLKGALAIRLLEGVGNTRLADKARQLGQRQEQINASFAYFTHRSFDFRTSAPLDKSLDTQRYMDLVCAGVHRHLMHGDERALSLAGRQHIRRGFDAPWALGVGRSRAAPRTLRRSENLAIRGCGYLLTKILDRCAQRIQFDRPSFTAAMLACPEGRLPIVLPTHRSYLDFLLIPYLFFSRPDLGLPMPYIAADKQFARIPVLGRIARAAHAFFLERGTGRPDPALCQAVDRLVADRQSVLFFIEGERSRSRDFGAPRRGLLRSLQSTGTPMVALPIAIDFDRVPEEATFESELAGAPSPGIRMRVLAGWLRRLLRGEIDLGTIQISCGEPIPFDGQTDCHVLSRRVLASMAAARGVSTYHLRCFVSRAGAPEIDVDFLCRAIRDRGGRVIESRLRPPDDLASRTELALRGQWMHHFFPEARVLYGEDPVIAHYLE
ncbi:MAG: SDR family oxidoreductase, partial [Deltaproteobacteria bacterium]|nr:SDR family oxidoreductase [Deltaproteobacteria bacterium]